MVEISCLTICMPLYKSYGRKNPRAKRHTGETTHLIRANRPTPKTRAKRPRAKRPGETTHGRNDPDSFCSILSGADLSSLIICQSKVCLWFHFGGIFFRKRFEPQSALRQKAHPQRHRQEPILQSLPNGVTTVSQLTYFQ